MAVVYLRVMGALLADEALPIVDAAGLIAVCLALILACVCRTRSQRAGSAVAQVFWRDASQAGYVWAGGIGVVLAGSLADVEGLRTPIWLVLALAAGLACLAIIRYRWRRSALRTERTSPEGANGHRHRRLVSTSWEVGLLAAGIGGLLAYGAAIAHAWGHPIHWVVAGVGLAVGYALGVVVATPRFTVRPSGS